MCRGWRESSATFLADMGPKPSPEHSLDRIDNDRGYWCGRCDQCLENGWPANCRWATPTEQAANTRVSPRPLTDDERARIERAQNRIPEAEEMAREIVRRAVAERDAEIAEAVKAGASQTDIADVLGITRQAVYNAIKRTGVR